MSRRSSSAYLLFCKRFLFLALRVFASVQARHVHALQTFVTDGQQLAMYAQSHCERHCAALLAGILASARRKMQEGRQQQGAQSQR